MDGFARQDHRGPEIVQVRKGNAQRKPYDSSPSLWSRFISIATSSGKKAAPSLQTSHPSSSFPSSSFLFLLLLEVHLLLLLPPKAPPSCTVHHQLFVPWWKTSYLFLPRKAPRAHTTRTHKKTMKNRCLARKGTWSPSGSRCEYVVVWCVSRFRPSVAGRSVTACALFFSLRLCFFAPPFLSGCTSSKREQHPRRLAQRKW